MLSQLLKGLLLLLLYPRLGIRDFHLLLLGIGVLPTFISAHSHRLEQAGIRIPTGQDRIEPVNTFLALLHLFFLLLDLLANFNEESLRLLPLFMLAPELLEIIFSQRVLAFQVTDLQFDILIDMLIPFYRDFEIGASRDRPDVGSRIDGLYIVRFHLWVRDWVL